MECNLKANKVRCNCTYAPCSRKGKCCECISYHLEMQELPACTFPAETEKTYDRSLKKFIEIHIKSKTGLAGNADLGYSIKDEQIEKERLAQAS